MRKLFLNITMIGALLFGSASFAGETYENEDANFRVTFPTEFEVEEEEEDGETVISLSCTYGSMIILGTIVIMEEEVIEDEIVTEQFTTIYNMATALGSKVGKDAKKLIEGLLYWEVDDYQGLVGPLDFKLEINDKKEKYTGFSYALIVGNVEYQFNIVAGKKAFDSSVESRFINSFEFLD